MAENYVVTQATPESISDYFSDVPEVGHLMAPLSRDRVEDAVASIPGLILGIRGSDHTSVESEGGLFTEITFVGMKDLETSSFGFRGGHIELIEDILTQLSSVLGPLLLFFGSGDNPRLFHNDQAEQNAAEQPATRL